MAGRKSKIEGSKHKEKIKEMLRDGLSPAKISSFLKDSVGENISVKTLERYRRSMSEVEMIHPSLLARLTGQVRCKIDEIEEMESLYTLQIKRIAAIVKEEEITGDYGYRTVDQIALAEKLIMSLLKIKQDLGLKPKADNKEGGVNIYNAVMSNQGITLKEALEGVPDEIQRRDILRTIKNAISATESGAGE